MPGKPKNKCFNLSERNKEIDGKKVQLKDHDNKLNQLVKEIARKDKRLKRLQKKVIHL